jgi:hypothetical protein
MVILEADFYTVLGVTANHMPRGGDQVEIVGYHLYLFLLLLLFFRFLFFFANHHSACLSAHRRA